MRWYREKRGNQKRIKMKIQRFSEFQAQIPYTNQADFHQELYSAFLESDLGKIYLAIPWDKLIKVFDLKSSKKGPRSYFSPRGKLALMFLKHYALVSDRKLIEQLNSNVDYQIFCDIVIHPSDRITNYKIVSEIRCELSSKLDIASCQAVLASHWRPYCNNKDSITCDATCYESYIRYPTDIKLMYEAVEWNYSVLQMLRRSRGQRMLRTKITKWTKRHKSYSKSKRPSRKEKRSLLRGLLKLLRKIHEVLVEEEKLEGQPQRYLSRRLATAQALEQQEQKFYKGVKPSNRIVSLDKPYLRPIVRGKEVKKVEFGAKVHKLQIDGISFIEHLSFDAFNEGTRLKNTIHLAQQLMHTQTKVVGADQIYATNANRNYVSSKGIKTDFKRKGKKSKYHPQFEVLHKAITKERATRLEGSFGTDKEHFLLNRIKARSELTEKAWIFFGIHTSNAIKIGRRMAQTKVQAA
jgi:hypothetical protein